MISNQPAKTDNGFLERSSALVMGVGGAGVFCVAKLVENPMREVDCIVLDVDSRNLEPIKECEKLLLAPNIAHGIGTGRRRGVGVRVALAEEERLKDGSDDEKSSENEDTMWEEQEKPDERYDLLSSIVKDIRYFLQTDDVSLQINTLNIVLEVCKIADKERKQSYLIPMIPLISSLLQTSHFTLFSSALSATMQIISSNPQSTVMYVKEKVWPALKSKLYSCLDARNGDYSQIRSAELADRVEVLICENLECVYSDSTVSGDICGELLEWINEKSKEGAIPEYCQKLLEKAGRFNFDVVAQMLIELDPNRYAAFVKKQRQGCVRYRKIVNAQHSTINSIFVESLIRVISFIVCLTSCHLLFVLYVVDLFSLRAISCNSYCPHLYWGLL